MFRAVRSLSILVHLAFLVGGVGLLTPAPVLAQGGCINGYIGGQWPCANVELISQVPNEDMGDMAANDLWGWTDPLDGREYVLFGKRDGTWFIEVTNPQLPRIVGELPATGLANSLWRDIKVVGHHMVVVSEASLSRLQVFDLTRLRNHLSIGPPMVFSTDTLLEGFSKAHNVVVHGDSDGVYVCGPNGIDGFLVYDFSSPEEPTIVGSWSEAYVHDAQVVTYSGPDPDHQGKTIMVASCADDVRILDVTDPTDIVELSSTGPDPYGYIHQGWLSRDQRFFLLGDESDEISGLVEETTTYVFDLEDLDNWNGSPVSRSAPTARTTTSTCGDISFTRATTRTDGSSSPSSGCRRDFKAHFDTQPELSGPSFAGSWSNYPDSGTIALSDQTTASSCSVPSS